MKAAAIFSIIVGIASLLLILVDVIRYPQKMKIMNAVWPLTALYSGPLGVWAYFSLGRDNKNKKSLVSRHQKTGIPFWQSVLKGTLHCGSGCTLGDMVSAFSLLLIPLKVFGSILIGDWLIEYIAAFIIGIVFQYYAIKPIKHFSTGKALVAALKADALSLTFWQIGMYGWMAFSNFVLFNRLLKADEPVFWLMMQIGMCCGFITAYPINWWLIKNRIKEAM